MREITHLSNRQNEAPPKALRTFGGAVVTLTHLHRNYYYARDDDYHDEQEQAVQHID